MICRLVGPRFLLYYLIGTLWFCLHASDAKSEWDPRLEGVWKVTEDNWGGHSREVGNYKFIITEGEFAFASVDGDNLNVGAYRVSVELKKPDGWLVMREEWLEESDEPWLGLYNVNSDTLRIIFGKDRPTTLTPPKKPAFEFTRSSYAPRMLTMTRIRPRSDGDKAVDDRRSSKALQSPSKRAQECSDSNP